MKRMLGATMVAMALVAIMMPTVASAVISSHSAGSTGVRFEGGRFVQVSAVTTCTLGEIVLIRSTLTQDDAFGEGLGALFCTGNSQTLPTTLRSFGGLFDNGTATLCLAVATVDQVRVTEAEQSCSNITLS
jgi:hypothetical protein